MPYIPKERRRLLATEQSSRPGDLNYEFTGLVNAYLRLRGLSYETINEVIGALECAKLEFYRRVVGPYENRKILENGDVYDPSVAPPSS